jgi:transposase-like protein
MGKQHRTAPDEKEQIINRISNEGVSASQAAKDHGIHENAIYRWLGVKADGGPNILEFAKVKRQGDELLRLVGEITLKLSETQKKR